MVITEFIKAKTQEAIQATSFGPYLENQYLLFLFIVIGFLLLAHIVLFIFSKYLQHIAKKTKTKADDIIFDRTKRPIFFLIVVYGLKVALLNLQINGAVTNIINSLMALSFIFILTRATDVVIEIWGESFAKRTRSTLDDVLLPLFHKATKVLFVIIAILWVLSIWGVDITPYLAGAGVAGLILGLALQDSLKNIVGGVAIIVDKNFHIGEVIRLESGETGSIQEIGLRSTKMMTPDNEIIFIPNGQLANTRITNLAKPNLRIRKIVDFSVEYGTDPEKVKKVVLEALRKIKDIHDDPYMDVVFVEMGDYGLKFKARFWVDVDKAYTKWVEATQAIYAALTKTKIGIPYPTHVVKIKK